MNPKIYFKIIEGILRPLVGQSAQLDLVFKSNINLKNNQKFYNEYTRNFIKENESKFEIYFSEDYEWNSNNNSFNFKSLETISDEEYLFVSSYKVNFDINKDYSYPIENNDNSSKIDEIRESIKNEKISYDSNKKILEKIKENYPRPSISKCGMHIDPFHWNYLVRNILKKQNTILIGPTGTGKTELVMTIANRLNIPCYVYDMGSMQDPLTDLLGSHRIENGSSIFDYAKFTQHVQESCIIVLDELSRAPLMANNILFPCLDRRRELPVEIAGSKDIRNIKIHQDCVFIATANIGVEYSGTNEVDAALMNRFLPLQLDYMSAEHEINVLMERASVSKEQAIKIVNFANRIRKDYNEELLTKSCSTRETIAMAEMIADGFSYLEAFQSVIVYKYSNPRDEEVAHIQRLLISL